MFSSSSTNISINNAATFVFVFSLGRKNAGSSDFSMTVTVACHAYLFILMWYCFFKAK